MPPLAPDVRIRRARPADAPRLGRFGAALARLHHRMDARRFFATPGMEAGYASWLAREMKDPRAVVLVATRGGGAGASLVGYAYGRLEGRDWNTLRDAAGVGIDLYVVPGARGRGTGPALLQALFDELTAMGAPRVIIQVAARNAQALQLFERLGFRRTLVELARERPRRRTRRRARAPVTGRARARAR